MVQLRSPALVLAVALVLSALAAPNAQAKTCADYTNQAAAQRGHDTRDADGDGIFCEALPCPCLLPGTPLVNPRPATPSVPAPGGSVSLGRPTRRAGCRTRGGLPDLRCTPGARFSRVTRAQVCRPGYASSVRNVSTATKDAVYRAYGLRGHFDGRDGEVDHLVSLELGGSNSVANLFPEAATPRPGSHEKDRLEDALHREVCDGRTSLARAQRLIARDWVAAYHARFG
jgi:5-methylcytosine-specific restriction endonuclease McrA